MTPHCPTDIIATETWQLQGVVRREVCGPTSTQAEFPLVIAPPFKDLYQNFGKGYGWGKAFSLLCLYFAKETGCEG